ncbi:hypothetical protein [Glycomyces harbinensis]|uniref:hypothetical protein n=1 Tax=Glycomyces harbinensis TaxID=58114 RepID=UPI001160094B|nr:hypothetical protein [Glycomyces harbinensis]
MPSLKAAVSQPSECDNRFEGEPVEYRSQVGEQAGVEDRLVGAIECEVVSVKATGCRAGAADAPDENPQLHRGGAYRRGSQWLELVRTALGFGFLDEAHRAPAEHKNQRDEPGDADAADTEDPRARVPVVGGEREPVTDDERSPGEEREAEQRPPEPLHLVTVDPDKHADADRTERNGEQCGQNEPVRYRTQPPVVHERELRLGQDGGGADREDRVQADRDQQREAISMIRG